MRLLQSSLLCQECVVAHRVDGKGGEPSIHMARSAHGYAGFAALGKRIQFRRGCADLQFEPLRCSAEQENVFHPNRYVGSAL